MGARGSYTVGEPVATLVWAVQSFRVSGIEDEIKACSLLLRDLEELAGRAEVLSGSASYALRSGRLTAAWQPDPTQPEFSRLKFETKHGTRCQPPVSDAVAQRLELGKPVEAVDLIPAVKNSVMRAERSMALASGGPMILAVFGYSQVRALVTRRDVIEPSNDATNLVEAALYWMSYPLGAIVLLWHLRTRRPRKQ